MKKLALMILLTWVLSSIKAQEIANISFKVGATSLVASNGKDQFPLGITNTGSSIEGDLGIHLNKNLDIIVCFNNSNFSLDVSNYKSEFYRNVKSTEWIMQHVQAGLRFNLPFSEKFLGLLNVKAGFVNVQTPILNYEYVLGQYPSYEINRLIDYSTEVISFGAGFRYNVGKYLFLSGGLDITHLLEKGNIDISGGNYYYDKMYNYLVTPKSTPISLYVNTNTFYLGLGVRIMK